ncbi:peptidase M23 [Bifidobacterium lemurum]|uniref:Peptidase M23 n=2 Tax=Bifidobacterium lemurum TaxID=1603886 RepID=A0A261FLP7_9BIFI|nr:peptidoglycan DD-metalloendopeptidase family protein [Bifidobacterium lemurum]OZG59915.1 peptidase M23 [Bifidobacterium lemurum]
MNRYIGRCGERHDQSRARKTRFEYERRQVQEERRRALASAMAIFAAMALLLACMLASGAGQSRHVLADEHDGCASAMPIAFTVMAVDISASVSSDESRCQAVFDWPVAQVSLEQEFRRPPATWASGHRGVDLLAEEGTVLLAPADGVVSFAGVVAGKDVVSVRHGTITSSFEPATTDLKVGSGVRRGEDFAVAGGDSDHCGNRCVHWGLRRGADDYLDPSAYTARTVIALKPTARPAA